MNKKKILKSISHKKIILKPLNIQKNSVLPLLTKSYTTRNTTRKYLSPQKNNSLIIENQVSSASKKLEIDKINLRILKERLEQKKHILNTLEGKTKKVIRKMIYYKLYEPIKRNKGRERELIDMNMKTEKEKGKVENFFKNFTENIDILVESNKKLKKEIEFQRKKKLELERIKEKIKQEITNKNNKLKEINKISNKI